MSKERFIYIEQQVHGESSEEFVVEQAGDSIALSYGPNSGVYDHIKDNPLVEMHDHHNGVLIDLRNGPTVSKSMNLQYDEVVNLYIALHHSLTAGATRNNKIKLAVYKEIDDGE